MSKKSFILMRIPYYTCSYFLPKLKQSSVTIHLFEEFEYIRVHVFWTVHALQKDIGIIKKSL